MKGGGSKKKRLSKLEIATLLAQTCVSGYTSFKGIELVVNADGDSWTNMTMAALLACVITMVLYTLWSRLIRDLPGLSRGLQQGLGGAVLATFLFMALGVSSVSTAIGIFGKQALRHELQVVIPEFEEANNQQYRNARLIGGFIPDLEHQQTRYRDKEEEETRTGSSTGSGGSGTVSLTYKAISKRFGAMADEVSATLQNAEALNQKAARQIEVLREIALRDVPVGKLSRIFQSEAHKLRTTLVEQDFSASVEALQRGLATLTGETEGRKLSARSAKGRKHQAEALEKTRQDLERIATAMASKLAELSAVSAAVSPKSEPTTIVTAIFRYASDFAVYWAIALCLDLAPLVLLAARMIPSLTLSTEEQRMHRILDVRVGDQLDLEEAKNVLRIYSPKKSRLTDTERHHFSEPDEDGAKNKPMSDDTEVEDRHDPKD
ncbi:MAG: hypothetical protein RIC85_05800 [Gammaproteobacteria bacterium]